MQEKKHIVSEHYFLARTTKNAVRKPRGLLKVGGVCSLRVFFTGVLSFWEKGASSGLLFTTRASLKKFLQSERRQGTFADYTRLGGAELFIGL